jgi:arylsulfatase
MENGKMKRILLIQWAGTMCAAFTLTTSSLWAQQINGTPGSPDATTTISGKQLPPPDSKFGGVIPTPALDRIAKAGLRYTQFHSTALCSPTRAALISGRNHHSMGFGVISEQATGFPGYDSIITRDKATIGRTLSDNGYATSWFGKNHNTPTYQYSLAGPFDQWPSGMGFKSFYGFMGGETNQWQPFLFRDHTPIFPWVRHPGYNLTTDMADEAIKYLTELNVGAGQAVLPLLRAGRDARAASPDSRMDQEDQ